MGAGALQCIRDATFHGGDYLDKRSRADAMRLRIEFAAHAGQYGESLVWFEHLKNAATVEPADPEQGLIEKIKKRLADPSPIRIGGSIPDDGRTPVWSHILLRRTFAFAEIGGRLDAFRLRCDQQEIRSPVSDTAEWKVPRSWSNCTLDVQGAPGAKFTVAEVDD